MAAYDEIIRRYQQPVAASLHHLCRDQSDLEDLVQETFIRSFRKLAKWTPRAPLLAWIRRIGYNLSYDYLRKQKRNPLALRTDSAPTESTAQPFAFEIADETRGVDVVSSRNDLITWLLRQLQPDEVLLITLIYVEQQSVKEIADRLGWSESKVKVKAFRARKKLKQFIKGNEELELQYSATL